MLISVIRTVFLYIFIIAAIRLMGKRQISEMQPSELVVTMVISDVASLPMQNTSQPLLSGVIPVIVLVILEIFISVIMLKSRGFRRAVCGNPVVLISDGTLRQSEMRRLRISNDELFAQLRQQGIFSLEDVKYCIVETNGNISVLEKSEKRALSAEDMGLHPTDILPETVVVSDGNIIEESLVQNGYSKEWVNRILSKNHMPLKQVFMLTVTTDGAYRLLKKETNSTLTAPNKPESA
ncbi:MAG: DUF421 domain-containing protein [Ruminococcus sp.]|nr:DUF421 domain-containing protein [Ruminococcus sp.]